jgi:hypothetical protein
VIVLESRAEQIKLAHVLRVEPGELEFLAPAPPEDLRELRNRISDALFEADRRHFEGIVKIARRLPAGLNATLAQRALGPNLAAHTANLLDPEVGADMIKRLPAEFLAEIGVHADPRKLAHLTAKIPPQKAREISAAMARKREWVVMGAFVSQLKPAALEAALEPLDAEALLHTGFVIEDKPGVVDPVVRLLSQQRLVDYGRAAVELDMLPEALDLLTHLTRRSQRRLGQALGALSDEELQLFADKVRAEPVLDEAVEPLREVAVLRVQAALDFS